MSKNTEYKVTYISETHKINICVDGSFSLDDQHRIIDWHLLTIPIPSNVKPIITQEGDKTWYKWEWSTTQRIPEPYTKDSPE